MNEDYVSNRILEAIKLRAKWSQESKLCLSENDAFRSFNSTFDGIPGLMIDIFAKNAIIHLYSKYWAEYLQVISKTLIYNPLRSISTIYLSDHIRYEEGEQVAKEYRNKISKWKTPSFYFEGKRNESDLVIVKENEKNFLIRLNKGMACGLYLDQRENRNKLSKLIQSLQQQNKSIHLLNCFSFSCSFSLYAALEGAETTSIDISNSSLELGIDNFLANNIKEDQISKSLTPSPNIPHNFLNSDVLKRYFLISFPFGKLSLLPF